MSWTYRKMDSNEEEIGGCVDARDEGNVQFRRARVAVI